jgi:poly(A)-specific ribonuclease
MLSIMQEQVDRIHEAAGFCRVLEMLRDSGKPAVGHNLAFDLTFTLQHLAAHLPGTWLEAKELAQKWYPGARAPPPSFLAVVHVDSG